jgi:hypothetical protein
MKVVKNLELGVKILEIPPLIINFFKCTSWVTNISAKVGNISKFST